MKRLAMVRGGGMTYIYELVRARKRYVNECSVFKRDSVELTKCRCVIEKGQLYIRYYGFGMATAYRRETKRYSFGCPLVKSILEKMLRYGVKRLYGYGGSYPDYRKPLSDEERAEIEKVLYRTRIREKGEDSMCR